MQDIQMGFDYNEKGELVTVQKNDPYRFDLDQHGFPVFSDKNPTTRLGDGRKQFCLQSSEG